VLWRVPKAGHGLEIRREAAQEAALAFAEARAQGASDADAIEAGKRAADCARRPPGSRSSARLVSDSLPGVAARVDAATAIDPADWRADAIIDLLPPDLARVARLNWLQGIGQQEVAHRSGVSRYDVRAMLDRAKALARAELARRGVGAKARTGSNSYVH
jgi:DNA-directed RNA polymerase specialized sigma24 family protein